MRRLMFVLALVGVLAAPAATNAAAPPDPTLAVGSVHYASRGVVELDVTYRCVAPSAKGAEWEPYLYVSVWQGRRERRYGFEVVEAALRCDGATHVQTLRITPEEGRGFTGRRVVISASLDAGWYLPKSDRWVDQSAWLEPFTVRLTRR